MYELFMNQLVKVETFESPNQPNGQAVIKNGVAAVKGYDEHTTIFFETIPEKIEPGGTVGELHYVNGNLEWVYVAIPPTTEDRIAQLESENMMTMMALVELHMMILAGGGSE